MAIKKRGEAKFKAPSGGIPKSKKPLSAYRFQFIMALVAAVILTGGYLFYHFQEQQTRQNIKDGLLVVAQLKTEQIAEWRAERLVTANILVGSPFFAEGVERFIASPTDIEAKDKVLARLAIIEKSYQYQDILLTDTDGKVLLSLNNSMNYLGDIALAQLAVAIEEQKAVLTDFHYSPDSDSPHMEAIAPIFPWGRDSSQAIGAVVFYINPSNYLYPLLQSWPMPNETAETLLVERDGDQVLFLNELRNQEDTALKLRIPLSQQKDPAVMAVLGKEGVVEGRDYRGVEVLSATTHIPDSPWYLVAKLDTSEALAVWRSQAGMIIVFFAGLLAAALALIGLVWQRRQRLVYQKLYQAEAGQKKLEQDLINSEAKYRRLFETAQDAILILDGDTGQITDANPFIKDMLGYNLEELQGKHLWEIGTFRDMVASKAAFKELAKQGYIRYEHLPLQTKDGHKVDVEFVSNRYTVDSREVFQCNIRNITERKRMEDEVKQSEEKYRLLVEQSPDIVWSFSNKRGTLFASSRVESILGYTPDYLYDNPWLWNKSIHPDDRQRVDQAIADFTTGKELNIEYRIKNSAGHWLWFNDRSIGKQEIGEEVIIEGISTDITEHKQADEVLRKSEEKYRDLVETIPDVVFAVDGNGTLTYLSPAVESMTGYSVSELIGRTFADFAHPEDLADALETFQLALSGQTGLGELRFFTKSGEMRWLRAANKPTFMGDRVIGVHGVFSDITESKRAEDMLRQSEERYRTILEQMGESYYEVDIAGNFTFVNDSLCRNLGRSREELLGMNYRAYTPREGSDATFKTFNKVYRTGEPLRGVPAVISLKDGTLRFVERSIFPLRDSHGKIIGFRGISYDVTERKRAEELIRLRLALFEFSTTHSLEELLQKTLDELEQLTGSQIGFYHFVEDDQKTLSLQSWSTRTVNEFCKAEAKEMHYGIDQAGVWVDCVQQRRPVIHNDYASLSHRKGMPEGHATVIRELVVPIMRADRIVAILGIGNKPGDYTERDIEIVSYLADVAWEITERKRAEEILEQSEDKYRTILNEIYEVYYETDLAGNYTFFNNALCRQTGYSREELMGMNYRQYTPKGDWKSVYEKYNQVYITGQPLRSLPLRNITKDGRMLYTEDTVLPLRNEKGDIIGFRGLSRDVTERRLAEEERRQLELKAQITSRLASVGEMAAGVAHEINNPLTGVTGYAQLLMGRKDLAPDIMADLAAINDGAQRVAGIVQRLLTFSRQTRPERKLVEINELIESTLVLRAYHLKVNNIAVVKQLAPGLLETVVDPGQIQQVLLNLIVNAETEMKLARGKGKLTITTEKLDKTIKISVKDNGPGIKPEVMDWIFDPFFTTRETGQGTGLGLSLCYGIITEHKGRIYVENKPGKGATFIVELPVITEVEPLKSTEPEVKKRKKKLTARILVVDDEQVVRELVNRVLTVEGHRVDIVDNADDTLKKIERHRYELILLDIKMPGINGVQLYKRIKKINKSMADKVVFMTGDIMSADTQKFLSEAEVSYISKPFNADQLKREVKRALSEGR